ncbi:estradiol 17-beta-dehydrogenase 2-like isoform X2 [Amblyraja radiata]|uniref:estradiol 17-beta-dehydrogenase 2-like isoform X2 n=1 Tax=Amblyraja radiata TaxID=386614 RepID=UPI00140251B4|nr:estradiol 17-beta-dehydrogenase 2-like isoform X2 [Amblyraja radiata]
MQLWEEMDVGSRLALGLYGFITVALGAAVVTHFQKSKARFNLNLCTCKLLLWLFVGFSLSLSYLPQYAGLVFFTLCCYLVYWSIRSNAILSPEGKAVLITGCDSGFGHALAKRLHSLGFHVFAMVLHEEGDGAKVLKSFRSDRLTVIQMDVTNLTTVQEVEKEIEKQLENKGLYALVNNAGIISCIGDTEIIPTDAFKRCMEVNFFGTIEVTKTFLPLIRRAKGRIINISSPSGQVGNVEFWEQQYGKLVDNLSPALLHDYGEDYFAELKQTIITLGPLFRQHMEPVIDTIVTALLVQHPKSRYTTEYIIDVLKILYYFLPSFMSDVVLNEIFVAHRLLPKGVRQSSANQ